MNRRIPLALKLTYAILPLLCAGMFSGCFNIPTITLKKTFDPVGYGPGTGNLDFPFIAGMTFQTTPDNKLDLLTLLPDFDQEALLQQASVPALLTQVGVPSILQGLLHVDEVTLDSLQVDAADGGGDFSGLTQLRLSVDTTLNDEPVVYELTETGDPLKAELRSDAPLNLMSFVNNVGTNPAPLTHMWLEFSGTYPEQGVTATPQIIVKVRARISVF